MPEGKRVRRSGRLCSKASQFESQGSGRLRSKLHVGSHEGKTCQTRIITYIGSIVVLLCGSYSLNPKPLRIL